MPGKGIGTEFDNTKSKTDDKAKPAARRGRKATPACRNAIRRMVEMLSSGNACCPWDALRRAGTGPPEIAGLPKMKLKHRTSWLIGVDSPVLFLS